MEEIKKEDEIIAGGEIADDGDRSAILEALSAKKRETNTEEGGTAVNPPAEGQSLLEQCLLNRDTVLKEDKTVINEHRKALVESFDTELLGKLFG